MTEGITGLNGFIWWTGVVESRQDPLNLGRCQVRVFGWHSDDKNQIPTSDLPWAQTLWSPNVSAINKTPRENDWVVGFFMDGKSGQFPCIMGILPGIPGPAGDGTTGFSDPQDTLDGRPSYLTDGNAQAYPSIPNEPSTSRLYRNESTDQTILGVIAQNKTSGVQIGLGGTWDQPDTSYAAVPPYNDVHETESGHVFELDDTPSAERIQLAHRTGTHIEFRPDGSRVIVVQKDAYEVIMGDNYVNIKGTCNITVNGDANLQVDGDVNAHVNGNVTGKVDGNIDATVGGNVTADISGDVTATVGGSVSADVSGGVTATVGGDMSATVGGDMSASVGGSMSTSASSVSMSAGGSFDISAGTFSVSAGSISLN